MTAATTSGTGFPRESVSQRSIPPDGRAEQIGEEIARYREQIKEAQSP
jgi:hypothetical protein